MDIGTTLRQAINDGRLIENPCHLIYRVLIPVVCGDRFRQEKRAIDSDMDS